MKKSVYGGIILNSNIRNITQIAILTAVLCVLSPLTVNIPVSPVPISFANFVIYIFAGLLGIKKSIFGVLIYLLLGMAGLPVFSKGSAGIGYIIGPTGGYLIGFLFCSLGTSLGSEIGKKFFNSQILRIIILVTGMVLGTIICYFIGTVWLSYLNKLDFDKALAAGVIPFIPGDIVKIIIAVILIIPIKKRLERII